MVKEMEVQNLVLLVATAVVSTDEIQERVWIEDLNSDHDRRHLDAGLPSSLKFNLKRQSGDLELTLEENLRLNLAAPVFELKTDLNGRTSVVQKKTEKLKGVNFYQDKRTHGAFSVKCQRVTNGPCVRMLTGNLFIENRQYDIEPAAEVAFKRTLDGAETRIPHYLTLNRIEHSIPYSDPFKTVEASDYLEVPGDFQWTRMTNARIAITVAEGRNDKDFVHLWKNKRQSARHKRATNLYAVELFIVADTTIWDRYYAITEATDTLNRTEATELYLRERFSFILNGISLRYESIEDPDMEIYCTVTGFLFIKTRDNSNPLPLGHEETIEGREYADASFYLWNLGSWSLAVKGLPENDHIMTFTYYELYSDFTNDTGVAGIAYVGAACGDYKVSVIEDTNFFRTTSAAAHELGHSLGAYHDGEWTSSSCSMYDEHIMAPWVPVFSEHEAYSINPWRFSQCSINAFKSFILNGSGNCFGDPGDFYNHEEYLLHTEKEPGELYDADTQCKLIHGDMSRVCSSTDKNNICRVMKCLTEWFTCRYYSAARGTKCGRIHSNKWCIEGNCVKKTAKTTTPSTTTTSTSTTTFTTRTTPTTTTTTSTISPTTPTTTTILTTVPSTTGPQSFQCSGDVGFKGFYCEHLRDILGTGKVCKIFAQECCATCGPKCKGNDDITLAGTRYNCEEALAGVLQSRIKVLCRVAGKDCCSLCT